MKLSWKIRLIIHLLFLQTFIVLPVFWTAIQTTQFLEQVDFSSSLTISKSCVSDPCVHGGMETGGTQQRFPISKCRTTWTLNNPTTTRQRDLNKNEDDKTLMMSEEIPCARRIWLMCVAQYLDADITHARKTLDEPPVQNFLLGPPKTRKFPASNSRLL